jgi:hypothetical protein
MNQVGLVFLKASPDLLDAARVEITPKAEGLDLKPFLTSLLAEKGTRISPKGDFLSPFAQTLCQKQRGQFPSSAAAGSQDLGDSHGFVTFQFFPLIFWSHGNDGEPEIEIA